MIRKAIFLLYRVLQTLASPAIAAWLLYRIVRNRHYLPTLRERFGVLPALWQRTDPGAIWLHAVSAGEVIAAVPLLIEIRRLSPRSPLYVSTSTLAGQAAADRRLAGLVDGIFFPPLDFVWAVRRVLRRLRPSLLIVMETEIWPNLFREVNRIGCGLVIVNGRISDKALPRYRALSWLFGPVLHFCDRIVTQSPEMRLRYVQAGARASTVEIGGNLKYDFAPVALGEDSPILRFIRAATKPVWIAASTSADERIEEETFAIEAQRALPGWRLIVAPRKPERFAAVAGMLQGSGLRWTRRTQMDDEGADVLLLDSIGELSATFAEARVVFMGGTLADKGGHNILEPALLGKPVIAGPHLENFRDIAEHFDERKALLRISRGDELRDAVLRADADEGMGARGLDAAREQCGAAARTAKAALAVYRTRCPSNRPPQPTWMCLWFFALIWRVMSARDRKRKTARALQLPVPVVSVGNITAGGTGKTPVTIELLRHFSNAGLLTRGHGRSTRDVVLLPRGDEELPVDITGDEAQLYLRSVRAPIGIGSERFEAGTQLLSAAPVKILFLDDGFQHLQLKRNFDLVLIDSLHPFGGGHLLPLGRLREPLEGLARADAFLITREDEGANVAAIESVLKRYNPHAPIFRARTVPAQWSGDVPDVPAIAFCGLGNPQAFWRTLDRLNVNAMARLDYGDHHRYTPVEIRRLRQHAMDLGAQVLLTTTKDTVNLCPEAVSMLEPLRLYWLEIRIEIDGLDELIGLITRSLN